MRDQAESLRRLVAQRGCRLIEPLPGLGCNHRPAAGRPQLVVAASGKGGVGTTTLAVNLAVAAAQSGRRCLLVDADGQCGDVASLTGVRENRTVADVLAGRRNLPECLQTGPAGIKVLAGAWGLERLSDYPPAAADKLIQQTMQMWDEVELAIFDCGTSRTVIAERFWRAADVVLAITSVEPASILDTYAAIKYTYLRGVEGRLLSVVNMSPDRAAAELVHQRLRQTCRRLLGIGITAAGAVRHDEAVAAANRSALPVVLHAPGCQAAKDLRSLAERALPADGDTAAGADRGRETLKIRAVGSR